MALNEKYDKTQVGLMEEQIVVIDENDRVLRGGSKLECHLNENIDSGLLHRAFSVFLFNSDGKLLLQQRSDKKITFPAFWANTCCSHPLYVEEELDTENQAGIKRAAIRKLGHELGIKPEQIPIEKFNYLTRIHYVAKEKGKWGEHEIDYVLFIQADVELNPEPNEVQSVRYFSEVELEEFLDSAESNGTLVSPWFKHLQVNFLSQWWSAMKENRLDDCKDHEKIHRFS